MVDIQIDKLRLDGGTQPRENISQATVDEYAQDMKAGAKFPAIVVFFDGTDYWLADGFHRYYAALQAGLVTFPADIVNGSQRDAILYSVGANGKHGLRRTNDDKRRAVLALLNDEEWQQWSDNMIAEKCGVSHTFVSNMRKEFPTSNGCKSTRTGADGRTINTAKIGKSAQPPIPSELRGDPACEMCGQPTKTRGLSMISKKWLCIDCIQQEIQANKAWPAESSGIDPDALYYFLPAYIAPDKKAHYCKSLMSDEIAAWKLAKEIAPSMSVHRGAELRKPATANPDIWIETTYDDLKTLVGMVVTTPPTSPKTYPTPAYCGQCDQVLDGWIEVDYVSVKRWQCPKCGINVPDGLMRPESPKQSIFGPKYPGPARCKKCGAVSEEWRSVEMGVGELRAQGWECPFCKAHILNAEMLPAMLSGEPHPEPDDEVDDNEPEIEWPPAEAAEDSEEAELYAEATIHINAIEDAFDFIAEHGMEFKATLKEQGSDRIEFIIDIVDSIMEGMVAK